MTGQEFEEVRIQKGWTLDEYARNLGITVAQCSDYVTSETIQDAWVINKVRGIQLELERKHLDTYEKTLLAQPTGRFKPGKILSHLDAIATLDRHPEQSSPITLEWHLSNTCNHNCPFCTFRDTVHGGPDRAAQFPDQLIDETITGLTKLGVKAVVHSGGGEPLIYPKVAEVIKKIGCAGLRQGVVTNGTNINSPPIRDAILEHCDWIRISIDAGCADMYKQTHGAGCNFEQLLQSIKDFKKERSATKPNLGVSFLLTASNYGDLVTSARRFREVGVDYFQVKPIVITADDRIACGEIFWRTQIFDQLNALPALAVRGKYEVYTLGFKFVDMMKAIHAKPFRRCYGHPFYPVISATGDVYVCCLMIGKQNFCYGRIDENTTFRSLWQSPRRLDVAAKVDVRTCPVNCKLSETNKVLEDVIGKEHEDEDFLN